MVEKPNVDKHRYSYPGLKGRIVETEKWGRDKAAQRYGAPQSPNMKPPDASQPQFRTDQASDRSFNDHANDWVRGRGENAENKPGYVRGGGKVRP